MVMITKAEKSHQWASKIGGRHWGTWGQEFRWIGTSSLSLVVSQKSIHPRFVCIIQLIFRYGCCKSTSRSCQQCLKPVWRRLESLSLKWWSVISMTLDRNQLKIIFHAFKHRWPRSFNNPQLIDLRNIWMKSSTPLPLWRRTSVMPNVASPWPKDRQGHEGQPRKHPTMMMRAQVLKTSCLVMSDEFILQIGIPIISLTLAFNICLVCFILSHSPPTSRDVHKSPYDPIWSVTWTDVQLSALIFNKNSKSIVQSHTLNVVGNWHCTWWLHLPTRNQL